jgi:hypothetical protein
MTTVEIHGRTSRAWAALRLTALVLWAFGSGYLLGCPDHRDWQRSTQTTKVVMVDPATGMSQTQEQSGSTESLTTPTPMTGKNATLFGTPNE